MIVREDRTAIQEITDAEEVAVRGIHDSEYEICSYSDYSDYSNYSDYSYSYSYSDYSSSSRSPGPKKSSEKKE